MTMIQGGTTIDSLDKLTRNGFGHSVVTSAAPTVTSLESKYLSLELCYFRWHLESIVGTSNTISQQDQH